MNFWTNSTNVQWWIRGRSNAEQTHTLHTCNCNTIDNKTTNEVGIDQSKKSTEMRDMMALKYGLMRKSFLSVACLCRIFKCLFQYFFYCLNPSCIIYTGVYVLVLHQHDILPIF